ncbi:Translation initiation factor 2 [Actinokineospora spheciospongiae]|uniref:Translation initiation factor 2 n=1 Tax=Actinokineospora spheciospongiae TaxID=909613 RepID=W7IUD9_9PSEU|nr:SHOCT domain-containing protein [Actinokineospora spheciospongiae]EWC60001.1 Translation initiation factor 2 [Actinokineospora spheciospongiae]
MSWQDELRKLDSALVAGELTADEYRQRRDRVMVEAAGQNQGGQPATPAQAAPAQPAPAQPTPPQPTPPTPPPPNAMESTQIVAPVSGGFPTPPQQQPGTTERTQVVPGQQQQPPQQAGGNESAERTQVVPGSAMGGNPGNPGGNGGDAGERTQVVPGRTMNTGPNTGPHGVPQGMGGQPHFPPPQPRPAWETARPQQNQGQSPPPWMNDDGLPPDFGSAQSWPRQGPEIFTESGGGGKGKKIAIIAAVVVLVAAGITAFFLFKPGGSDTADPGGQNPPAASSTAPATPTGPKLPKGPFVVLDGTELDNQNITIDTAVKGKVPTEAEAAFLKAQGVTNVGMYVTKESDLVRAVWSFTPAAGADPKVLLTALDGYFANHNHTELSGLPDGVLGRALPDPAPGQRASFRGFYIADGVVLQIEAYGPDQAAAKEAFDKIVADQVKKFPPAA